MLVRPAVLPVLVGLLLAGCGGGTTTVIERTVTQRVPAAPKGGGAGGTSRSAGKGASTETAAAEEAAREQGAEGQEPERIIHLRTFRDPSGNIGCLMSEGGVRCDIRKRNWSAPERPAKCPKQVDFGQGLEVTDSGEASFVCAGDTALDPGAAALAFGTASEIGGSECIDLSGGISCVNGAGHGFFLGVRSYQVF